MAGIEFQPATEVSLELLSDLFTRCYAGYFVPLAVSAEAMARMIPTWDLDLARSRVGFRDGAPVAVAMLGVRESLGWIGGMGVVAEARGLGLGRLATIAVLDEARRAGLPRVELEVIDRNANAIPIYEELGFRDTRSLDIWSRDAEPVDAPGVQAGAASPRGPMAEIVPLAEALAAHASLHDSRPPWQRDLRSLRALAGDPQAIAVRRGSGLAACAICRADPTKVQIFDVGVAGDAPAGALEAVLAALVARHPGQAFGLVNLPADDPAARALPEFGFRVIMRQREMALTMTPGAPTTTASAHA